MTGNVWFISGATSGFGKHIALEALSRGDSVVATSRTATSKLSNLADQGALLIDLDVTAPDAEIRSAFGQAVARFGKITHFINAAGYILEGPVEGASSDDIAKTFNVNVLGNMNLSRHEVALLRKQGKGGVIANFGSLASWSGGPAYAYYCATKWAISGFTESLYAEVKEFGISGVVIEPGYFRTGFLNTDGGNRMFVSNSLEEEYRGTSVEHVRNALNEFDNNQAGDVVKGCKVIVDVLTRSGVAEGKEIPMRLPLGPDTIKGIQDKIAQTSELLKEWTDVVNSTDHDDVKNA
ncbi:hypothetical protein BKA67DRAFT_197574 [Truncatella angustata]|uniref:Uncharacterized protein n=1 Tax=Truncatella angustata TaxID=152316 RepID=A0A9P8UT99_9PEZI|nr:uncharacterized protein BKA67DRAFT_197574 [Truncatella angustata]KAH6657766.1 hypothetical protein BKA67DRAFT_197574 [Truncatella angustata]KAH8204937.1 hypothetical protein TruAng_000820 [Truncatella angustata]